MIEKVSFLDSSVNCVDYQGYTHNVADSSIINKINEIIALLNAIVVDVDGTKCIDGSKKAEPADPYEEQRKWIGKLCRMKVVSWDCIYKYKVLERINENDPTNPFVANDGERYCECEPVKPDDDIIYKGE